MTFDRVIAMARRDFFMGDRLPYLRKLLAQVIARGYAVVSVAQWAERVERGDDLAGERLFVFRQDVDSDAGTARRTAALVRELGGNGSFFFRLRTLAPALMQDLARQGLHVSYHYEELATVAKQRRLATRADVEARMPEIRALFAENLRRLRRELGLPLDIVCSHGDWINRRLGIGNTALLDDPALRRELGIRHETYDAALAASLQWRFADELPPAWWQPAGFEQAVAQATGPIYLLTHPRNWRSNARANLGEIRARMGEELRYRFSGRSAS